MECDYLKWNIGKCIGWLFVIQWGLATQCAWHIKTISKLIINLQNVKQFFWITDITEDRSLDRQTTDILFRVAVFAYWLGDKRKKEKGKHASHVIITNPPVVMVTVWPTSVCRRCFWACSWQRALLYSSSWFCSTGTFCWACSFSCSFKDGAQTHKDKRTSTSLQHHKRLRAIGHVFLKSHCIKLNWLIFALLFKGFLTISLPQAVMFYVSSTDKIDLLSV